MTETFKSLRTKGSNVHFAEWEAFEGGLFAEVFVDREHVKALPSWSPDVLER